MCSHPAPLSSEGQTIASLMQAALTEFFPWSTVESFPRVWLMSPCVSVMDLFHLLMNAKACWERDVGEEEKMGLRRKLGEQMRCQSPRSQQSGKRRNLLIQEVGTKNDQLAGKILFSLPLSLRPSFPPLFPPSPSLLSPPSSPSPSPPTLSLSPSAPVLNRGRFMRKQGQGDGV